MFAVNLNKFIMPIFSITRKTCKNGKTTYSVINVSAKNRHEAQNLIGSFKNSNTEILEKTHSDQIIEKLLSWLFNRAWLSLRCLTFWAMVALVVWWSDARHQQIELRLASQIYNKQRALQVLKIIPKGGAICSDGWISGNNGRGACSHHGGISLGVSLLELEARSDPWYEAERARKMVENLTCAIIVAALFLAPKLERRL